MPEYRRFISYIYEYQNGRKSKNCGFVKVEIRNGVCRMRLHMQTSAGKTGALNVYAFVRAHDKIQGILLGNVLPAGEVYDFQAGYPAGDVAGRGYSMEDVRGIWLRTEQQEHYITVWDDEPVDVDRFFVWENLAGGEEKPAQEEYAGEPEIEETGALESAAEKSVEAEDAEALQAEEAEVLESAAGQPVEAEDAGALQAERVEILEDAAILKDTAAFKDAGAEFTEAALKYAQEPEAGEAAALESTADSDSRDISVQPQEVQMGNLWMRWENFLNHYPQIQPFSDGEITQCIAIAPKDISFLQRVEWQFIRNTFVRQAYTRYHHLLLGCHISGRFVLAIPGTSGSQERHMARMHGFLYYKEANAYREPGGEVCAAGDERRAEPQGYWFRFLNEKWPR